MGFRIEKYNDNTCNLIASFQNTPSHESYFSGNNLQDAINYFNLYLENNTLHYKTDEEIALDEVGIDTAEEAILLREQINTIISSYTDEQALESKIFFPNWVVNKNYVVGDRVRYCNHLFKVLQAHTSQEDWKPTLAPSLFARILTNEEDPTEPVEWEQPTSTNPYLIGDKVIFEGHIYESLIDNNVWSPADYPTGWQQLDTEEPTEEPTSEIPEWVQPDATSAYNTGDRVMFNNQIYESVIDNNVWSPEAYPAGWVLVEE